MCIRDSPRKRRSGRKVGQDARARGGAQVKWGRAGVISTIDPIFGVFLTTQSLGFLGVICYDSYRFKVNTAVRTTLRKRGEVYARHDTARADFVLTTA